MSAEIRWIAPTLACLLLAPASLTASDTLASLREEVRQPDEPKPSKPAQPKGTSQAKRQPWSCQTCQRESCPGCSRKCGCDDDDDSLWDGMFDAALVGACAVVSAPFVLPHTYLEQDIGGEAAFPRFPYDDTPGALRFACDADGAPPRKWGRQLRLEYGDDFSGLSRVGGQILIEHSSRWGLDASANGWRQNLAGGGHDQLYTGDANLLYRFAQNEHVQLRSGLGLNWLADDAGSEWGGNFTYRGDVYPVRPLVLSAELDLGWLGDAWLVHARATAGVVYRRTEVYAGYDTLQVGGATLNGLVAGLRYSF